ncbi:FprA family A-type flavoprotein [Methanothermobacter marburgensis]|uniref:F420H2 oxidase n=1 Tax=Methanothermobacter marburgensis (strain ATCC BAA-927 / DSM 2133 / JCM 14651 / NBRC 100331 / OCM 82 / Marburg) TaxID=79929 RepID=D9PVL6_METTM|nr:FprA family A-type flavoprotein [Methanothermobacter marburgensis]ADL58264.1 F420H2 oxidase [Methanothermobacter marburgensis str. Marburg]WBF10427.1 FprA family A-type flavoprotein [Methanothermobacter marburgensis]
MKADAVKIADGVYWVGVMDWDIRNYHGYTLGGTTYNVYLVFGDDKVALIDNTYPGTSPQMFGRISDAFEREGRDESIDLIIQNHIERDHSGSILEVWKRHRPEIICTEKASEGLREHYPIPYEAVFKTVKTGDSIDLGGKTLTFLEAPMLHWPDSMFTLLGEDGILFSNDAFGQHLCISRRFDTDVPEAVLMDAAMKFYANLLTPLSPLVLRKFSEVKDLGLLEKIRMIAPSHGQIWTEPMKIIEAYTAWATGECRDKATIIYDTMHYSTRMLAHALAEGLMAEDVDVSMHFLHEDERSEIVKNILESKALFIGSPTMFNGPFPSLGDIMYYLKGLTFDRTGFRRLAVVFGSKGWGGGAVRTLKDEISAAGFEVAETLEVSYVPDEDDLARCYSIGKSIGKRIKEM